MIMKIELERIFPSTDDGARRNRMHLLKLLAWQNDIVVNAKAWAAVIAEAAENETPDAKFILKSEQAYLYRVICSHMFEVLGVFKKCRESGVIEGYRPLVDDGESLYQRLLTHSNDSALLGYLEAIRNRTFHYGYDGDVQEEGLAVFGNDQTAANCRYVIAENAIMSRIHEQLGLQTGSEQLQSLHEKATALRSDIQRFVDRFMATIYERHPAAFSRQHELENLK